MNDDVNPFEDPQETLAGMLITLMRVYDVLMVQLAATYPEIYEKVYDKHKAGGIMTPMPAFDPDEILEK